MGGKDHEWFLPHEEQPSRHGKHTGERADSPLLACLTGPEGRPQPGVPDDAHAFGSISKTTPPPGRLKASFVLETVLCLTRSRLIQSYASLLGPTHPSEVGGKSEVQTNF